MWGGEESLPVYTFKNKEKITFRRCCNFERSTASTFFATAATFANDSVSNSGGFAAAAGFRTMQVCLEQPVCIDCRSKTHKSSRSLYSVIHLRRISSQWEHGPTVIFFSCWLFTAVTWFKLIAHKSILLVPPFKAVNMHQLLAWKAGVFAVLP